jgi:hypothetical protein
VHAAREAGLGPILRNRFGQNLRLGHCLV